MEEEIKKSKQNPYDFLEERVFTYEDYGEDLKFDEGYVKEKIEAGKANKFI